MARRGGVNPRCLNGVANKPAATSGEDRRGAEAGGGRDHAVAAGGDGVTRPGTQGRVRLKYRAHVEMGQSPPSAEYSHLPDEGLPFLQGTADFGPLSPVPRVYCASPTKVAACGDILFSVRAPVGELKRRRSRSGNRARALSQFMQGFPGFPASAGGRCTKHGTS